MTTSNKLGGTKRPNWKISLPVLAAMTCLGQAGARPLVTINDVADSPALIAAFAQADADTGKDYKLVLRWRQDANGNTVQWGPLSTITLKRGHVYVLGSQSNNYPERYLFDGLGVRTVFAVMADAGYKPSLTLSGITVRNGYANFVNSQGYGGGLWAYKADDIQIYYCKFLNNKSSLNGSGIAAYNTRNFYMLHTVVDGNINEQYNACGGGLTAGGGGIAIMNNSMTTSAAIHNNTISNNKTCRGGGVELWGSINLNMYENTISGNIAQARAGGILWHGGSGTHRLRFNTIAYNQAGTASTGSENHYGGGLGLWGFSGVIYSDGNVIAKNDVVYPMKATLGYNGHDCFVDASTATGSPFTNVVGKIDNCSQFGSSGSWGIGTDASPFNPKLQALAVGSTNESFAMPVHVPFSDSPLRGNFFSSGVYHQCDYKDQRSLKRPNYSSSCDIGSVEYGGIP